MKVTPLPAKALKTTGRVDLFPTWGRKSRSAAIPDDQAKNAYPQSAYALPSDSGL